MYGKQRPEGLAAAYRVEGGMEEIDAMREGLGRGEMTIGWSGRTRTHE